MAITDENQGQNNNQSQPASQMSSAFAKAANPAAAPQQQTNQGGQRQQAQRGAGGFKFSELGRLYNQPMGRTPASETLTKLNKALTTIYENTNKAYEITLLPIDMNNTSSLNVSVLVVATREIANKDLGVAFHTLILEASTDPIPPRFEMINGQNVEIMRTVGEAHDAKMVAVVAEAVSRAFPNTQPLNADAEVVPRDFDVTDEAAVYALASNAAYACSIELEKRRSDFVDLNLSNASKDENLTVRTHFAKTQIANAVGQPVRSDITIDLSAVAKDNQVGSISQGLERVSAVSRISGFLDLMWSPLVAPQNAYQPYQAQQVSYQRYLPRFVMTNLETVPALTLPAQLLTLVTALALRENNSWVQGFRPAPFTGSDVDMHDIGAIGIEANFENNATGFGSRVDTKADSFKPDSLHKLVASVIRPGLILSLDVSECGADTFYNGVFAAAAENNPRANEEIIAAANYLTNGAFQRHFPANGRIAIDENNRIHLGHYTDRQGVKRDLRDFDYLAIMNLIGEKDPDVIKDWSDTFLKTQYHIGQRLAARKRIIQALAGEVTFTGFARRVTFESVFVDALAAACAECGLDVKSVAPYADAGSYERATAQFADSTLLDPNKSAGLFNRGYGGGNGQPMGANRQFGGGRWY